MTALSFKDMLAYRNGTVRKVQAFGGDVYLRPLAGNDRDAFEQRYQKDQLIGIRAFVVAGCLCDEQGKRLKLKPQEIQELGEADSPELDKLFEVACELSGLREKDVRRAEKNS